MNVSLVPTTRCNILGSTRSQRIYLNDVYNEIIDETITVSFSMTRKNFKTNTILTLERQYAPYLSYCVCANFSNLCFDD